MILLFQLEAILNNISNTFNGEYIGKSENNINSYHKATCTIETNKEGRHNVARDWSQTCAKDVWGVVLHIQKQFHKLLQAKYTYAIQTLNHFF